MTAFPDLVKDSVDVASYAMDWASRLPAGVLIASATFTVNGDVAVTDVTAYPAAVLLLRVAGGWASGWTGDPQASVLSVVTARAVLGDGQVLSRSFNVIERPL